MSGFPIFQDYQYAWVRVLNISWDAIMEAFWILEDCNMPDLWIWKRRTRFWIWLNNAWINRSDYGRVLHVTGQSFTGFWICFRFRIFQGSECDKIVDMRELHRVLNMPEYVLIMLHMLEYTSRYLNQQTSEYARILNVSDGVSRVVVQITEQLSRQTRIQDTFKDLRWSVLQKKKKNWLHLRNQTFF